MKGNIIRVSTRWGELISVGRDFFTPSSSGRLLPNVIKISFEISKIDPTCTFSCWGTPRVPKSGSRRTGGYFDSRPIVRRAGFAGEVRADGGGGGGGGVVTGEDGGRWGGGGGCGDRWCMGGFPAQGIELSPHQGRARTTRLGKGKHEARDVPSPTHGPSCVEPSRGPKVCHGRGVELSSRHVAAGLASGERRTIFTSNSRP